MLSLEQARTTLNRADCVFSADEVEAALDAVAARIGADYADKNPLILCVMKGGAFTSAMLLQRMQFPLEFDYIQVTRYRNTTRGGEIDWRVEPDTSIEGRHVLIVDDILDEGVTLQAIVEYCRRRRAASVEVAVLARKRHPRVVDGARARYIALELPDRYVFGCGMDYRGYFRNFNGIYAVNDPGH